MNYSDFEIYCEIKHIENLLSVNTKGGNTGEEFAAFIAFCAERLNKGEQVQAIWSDFLDSMK